MRVLLHIGYPKTATTYLQKVVFPSLDTTQVNYLPYSHIRKNKLHKICNQYMESVDSNEYRSRLGLQAEKLNVISYEAFIGNWRIGGLNQHELFLTLKKVFGDPKILIVIRSQPSMIVSLYKQYIQEGGTSPFHKFISSESNIFFNKDFLDYNLIIQRLNNVFGPENIHVLPYELLQKNDEVFIKLLCGILEITSPDNLRVRFSNRSLHYYLLTLLRLNNYFLKGSIHSNYLIPGRILTSKRLRGFLQSKVNSKVYKVFPKADRILINKYKNHFEDLEVYYKKSNASINEYFERKYNINLKDLGYPYQC